MSDYIVIPDTSDNTYWELKIKNNGDRSTTFVPRDKELHHDLKVKAWKIIQSKQTRKPRVKA